ncbi:MAG: hypothetical protein J5846_09595 [Desulfovibrio sp.]|nr:hypothetical protein [Desulfovibrio sp.]
MLKILYIIIYFLIASTQIAYAEESDVFAKDKYNDVINDIFQNRYMHKETLDMYAEFLKNKTICVGGAPAVYFNYKVVGNATKEKGYPIYISLHGGGKTTKEENDQQWQNQIDLYNIPFGIYIAPRAPWNDWDMWFKEPIDRIIEEFIKVFYYSKYTIDLNRIYLLGYSAGGDGVWRLATRMPDAFAAASMMAGHPGDVSLVNLYNLPFMIWVGENDSAYHRNEECAQRIQELAQLRKRSNDQGYLFSGHIVQGKGHWMDHEDDAALSWISKFTRNLYPNHVIWRQEEVLRCHMYQLEVDINKAQRGMEAIVDFDYANNSITVKKSDYDILYININDDMFDMDKNIKVFNQARKIIFEGIVERKKSQLLHSLHVYGGIYAKYPGQIAIHKKYLI